MEKLLAKRGLMDVFAFLNFSRQPVLGVIIHSLSKNWGFLSAFASNNQFIIKLFNMWPGGTPHVVVRTSKISLKKKKNPKKEFSRVL